MSSHSPESNAAMALKVTNPEAIGEQLEQHSWLKQLIAYLETISLEEKSRLDKDLLINWEEIFKEGEITLPTESELAKWANRADTGMTSVYIALNLLALGLSLAYLTTGDITPLATQITGILGVGEAWNYFDSGGSFTIALHQWRRGEKKEALGNAFSGTQLLGFTLAGIIGHYATHTVSATVASGFLGFSFAACMLFSAGLEHYAMNKHQDKLQELERELTTKKHSLILIQGGIQAVENQDDRNTQKEEIKTLEQLILIERAKIADHHLNRNIWAGCALGMLAIAFVSVNVFTFGAPAIAMAVAASTALTFGLLRHWYMSKHKDSHLNAIKNMDVKTLNTWFELLGRVNEAKAPSKSNSYEGNASYLAYINAIKDKVADLCHSNPEAAQEVITLLDQLVPKDSSEDPKRTLTEEEKKLLFDHLGKVPSSEAYEPESVLSKVFKGFGFN